MKSYVCGFKDDGKTPFSAEIKRQGIDKIESFYQRCCRKAGELTLTEYFKLDGESNVIHCCVRKGGVGKSHYYAEQVIPKSYVKLVEA